MIEKALADKLTALAVEQLAVGLRAKADRMRDVQDIIDLYNNKIITINDGAMKIPFPFLAKIIDSLFSKIDNTPSVQFRLPNKKLLADKVAAAWEQERTSMKAGWNRKDRAEKKDALFSGRGVCKIYATSISNKYQSHYDVVDIFSFVADPTRGHLSDGRYHGETDIFKTHESLRKMAELGIYNKSQVSKLLSDELTEAQQQVVQNKINRIRSMNVTVDQTAFVGQKGTLLTEWIMKYEDKEYYLFFDPLRKIWVRAEELKDVFDSGVSPYISWATHYDEFSFWTKGVGDDLYPIAEAIRIILNNAIMNEIRRTRPQRIVEAGAFPDVNEIIDYIPDDVIVTNNGKQPNIITVETPEVSASIDVATFLSNTMNTLAGIAGQGVDEKDPAVGVFYGQLQQEADFIGIYNKAYTESYAEKGYNFFWGLKQHLTGTKALEMLGKGGVRLEELKSVELKDVDDVDDVIVSGGAAEQELNAIKAKQQADTLSQLSGNPIFSVHLNPKEVIKMSFKAADIADDVIERLLDVQGDANSELMEEADEAIASVLNGKTPKLNQGATGAFMQRILDYVKNNLDYIKLDKRGREIGIDKKMKQHHDDLIAYALAHQRIVLESARRNAQASIQAQMQPASNEKLELPTPSENEIQLSSAQPFENPQGTPQGTAEASQIISPALA